MKKQILLLVIICLCLSTTNANGFTTPHHDNPPDLTPIELHGRLDLNHGSEGVEAFMDDYYVYIYFHRDFGNVSISLYDDAAYLIYSDVVATSIQQTVIIPISGFSSGTFILELNNAWGCTEGEFDREP